MSFYCNIILSQYCAQKYCVWIGPKSEKVSHIIWMFLYAQFWFNLHFRWQKKKKIQNQTHEHFPHWIVVINQFCGNKISSVQIQQNSIITNRYKGIFHQILCELKIFFWGAILLIELNLVWKYFKTLLQHFEEKIPFIKMSFYLNIVCKYIVCNVGITVIL